MDDDAPEPDQDPRPLKTILLKLFGAAFLLSGVVLAIFLMPILRRTLLAHGFVPKETARILGFIFLALALAPELVGLLLLWLLNRHLRRSPIFRIARGECPRCGYDLKHSLDVRKCPNCGATPEDWDKK